MRREEHDGWIDFFFGDAQAQDHRRHSLLDARTKVGVHYHKADLPILRRMACPSPDIPKALWQQLQPQFLQQRSFYRLFNQVWHG